MTVEIIPVAPPAVARIWPIVEPMLAKPIEETGGCYLPEDVVAFCQRGVMQLWIAAKGEKVLSAYVTEIVVYPRKKRVLARFAGGEPHTIKEWLEPMVKAIEDWSKGLDCSGIDAAGRKGWLKLLESDRSGVWLSRDYPSMELH